MLTLKSLATQALTGDGGNSLTAGGNTGLGADSAGGGVNSTTPHIGLMGKQLVHIKFSLPVFREGLIFTMNNTASYERPKKR